MGTLHPPYPGRHPPWTEQLEAVHEGGPFTRLLPLDYESSLLTTFNTYLGWYRWKRPPFSICVSSGLPKATSPSSWRITRFCLYCWWHHHTRKRTETHDHNLNAFLQRCLDVGIKLNKENWSYGPMLSLSLDIESLVMVSKLIRRKWKLSMKWNLQLMSHSSARKLEWSTTWPNFFQTSQKLWNSSQTSQRRMSNGTGQKMNNVHLTKWNSS